jgi:hypothetical protein
MRLRACFFAALLLGACDSGTAPEDQLRLHVSIQPAVVSAEAPALVTVTVVNVSDRSVTVPLRGCPQLFEVRTLEGEIVGPEPIGCRLEGILPTVLAPDQEWQASHQWNGAGLGGDPARLILVPLPPGEYRINAALYPKCPTCVQKRSESVPVVVQ